MTTKLTIGELAKAADVPISTVRYYERAEILKPSGRSAGNYRVYSEHELERLRFIRAAQATGFRLEDIKALLRSAACGKVQGLIEERLFQLIQIDEVGCETGRAAFSHGTPFRHRAPMRNLRV